MMTRKAPGLRNLARPLGANLVAFVALVAFVFGVFVGLGLVSILESKCATDAASIAVVSTCPQGRQENRTLTSSDVLEVIKRCQLHCDTICNLLPYNKKNEGSKNTLIGDRKGRADEGRSTIDDSDDPVVSRTLGTPQLIRTEVLTYGNVYHSVREDKSILSQSPIAHRFKNISVDAEANIFERMSDWTSQQWEAHAESIMRNNVQDGILILALANHGIREMTMNFVASLAIHQYEKFVIICLDLKIYKMLVSNGHENNAVLLPRHWVTWNITEDLTLFGAKAYMDIVHAKLEIVLQVLARGYRLFFTDVDVVFLSPYVTKYILMEDLKKKVDFFYMVDSPRSWGDEINSGFFVARPSHDVVEMFNRTLILSLTESTLSIDQMALNHYIRKEKPALQNSPSFVALPRLLFPSGFFFKRYNFTEALRIYPMILHANHIAGMSSKERYRGFSSELTDALCNATDIRGCDKITHSLTEAQVERLIVRVNSTTGKSSLTGATSPPS